MATMHVYQVGRVIGGAVDVLIAPRRQQPVCSDDHGCHCYAYSHGYDDAKAGYLPEPLHHVSALCCIDRYMQGHHDACTVMDAAQKPARDGALQRVIDYGAEVHDLEDARFDYYFNRLGC